MKLLITGVNGLLGQHLTGLLLQAGYVVVGLGRGPVRYPFGEFGAFTYYGIDITNDTLLQEIMEREKPECVIHAAAMTQVDECQLNQEKSEAINVMATASLLTLSEEYSRYFLYISTDFVFDGTKGNYKEADAVNPINWYGFTKVQAEAITQTSTIPWAIVRTCLVFGKRQNESGNNIISWIKKSLENETPIKLVNDQWRTPTFAEDLAAGLLLMIEKRAGGIYHLSGKDRLTPYAMALETASFFKLDPILLEPVDAVTFQQPAKRPLLTGLDITKSIKDLGFAPKSFKEGLRKMFS